MNVEIILRDSDGRQTERLSMDCDAADVELSITGNGEHLPGFIEGGARYTPPGPLPASFSVVLAAIADNLTRTVVEPVTQRETPTVAEAAFLRDLAEILHYVPAVHGVDTGHVDACNDAADEFEKLEQQLGEIHKAQTAIITDKARLIYHVLRLLEATSVPTTRTAAAGACLIDLGYAINGNRARQTLALGGPARQVGGEAPESPLPFFMREAVTELVEDVVDTVSLQRERTDLQRERDELREAVVTIVSVIAGRPEGVEIDRYAGWASVVASNVLQGQPYPATPREDS